MSAFLARTRMFLLTYRLPILSGILIGTSYIPFPPWALFFCLAPLFLFWQSNISPKQAFIGGWIAQFILNLIGFHWIAHTAIEFGHFPVWAGVLTLFAFAAIAHTYYAFAGLAAVWISRRLKVRASLFLPLAFFCFAILEHRFPMIFPWHLGYPWLWAGWPGAQTADVIGFEGLNVVTIAINVLLAFSLSSGLLTKAKRYSAASLVPIALVLTLILGLNLTGLQRAEPWKQTDAAIDFLAVQGNIGNFDKILAEKGRGFREPIINKYVDLSREGVSKHPGASIMIWPETAFPDMFDVPYVNDAPAMMVRRYIGETKIPLVTGSYSYDPTTKQTFNGIFFLDDAANVPAPPYRKSILLVFGETFPFSEYLPYMDKLFPGLGSFGRGEGPSVMPVRVGDRIVRLGPQICYEGLYPWFTAETARKGAQVLINVTNDSWFGRDFEPWQHLYMTFARAIEFRRPLMRSTNTGVTTAILASGEILPFSPIGEEWTGLFHIPYKSEPTHTFYEKIAGLWIWPLVIGLVALIVLGRDRRARSTPTKTK